MVAHTRYFLYLRGCVKSINYRTMNEQSIKQLNELALKSRQERDKWLRHIFQYSVLFLGVLISLYKKPAVYSPQLSDLIYLAAISSLSLGILFCGIALFSAAIIAKHQFYAYKEVVLKRLGAVYGDEPKIFAIVRIIAYIFYTLALLGFVSYLWLTFLNY